MINYNIRYEKRPNMKFTYLDQGVVDQVKKKGKALFTTLNQIKKLIYPNELYLVGGATRDILLSYNGLPNIPFPTDIDLVTPMVNDQIDKRLQKSNFQYQYDKKYKLFSFNVGENFFQIQNYRKDVVSLGRHAIIKPTINLMEEGYRRDFTINSIYMDENCDFVDPYGGLRHIKSRSLKFIKSPRSSIRGDYLRIHRLIRFSTLLNKTIKKSEIKRIIFPVLKKIKKFVSFEKSLYEIEKIFLYLLKGFLSYKTFINLYKVIKNIWGCKIKLKTLIPFKYISNKNIDQTNIEKILMYSSLKFVHLNKGKPQSEMIEKKYRKYLNLSLYSAFDDLLNKNNKDSFLIKINLLNIPTNEDQINHLILRYQKVRDYAINNYFGRDITINLQNFIKKLKRKDICTFQ